MRAGLAGERLPLGQRRGAALLLRLPVNEMGFVIEAIVRVPNVRSGHQVLTNRH